MITRGECTICGCACDDLTHLQLYVIGSEGIEVCLQCRIALAEVADKMRQACIRAQMTTRKRLRALADLETK